MLAGLSVAFDASCEEMWLAWRHGACLVPAPRSLVRSGMDLGPWLVSRDITVVSTVMSNLGFRQAMQREGIAVIATAVGDRYVLEAMRAEGYDAVTARAPFALAALFGAVPALLRGQRKTRVPMAPYLVAGHVLALLAVLGYLAS